jgi:hypothetical protein
MEMLLFLEAHLIHLNQATNGGGMSEYLISTGKLANEWDIWSCAGILAKWIDQKLSRKEIDFESVDEAIVGGEHLIHIDEKLEPTSGETSTVDAVLLQLVGYLNHRVKAISKCLDETSYEDAKLAALHFLKRQGLAVTKRLGRGYRRHWYPSSVAYEMLQLTICGVSLERASLFREDGFGD